MFPIYLSDIYEKLIWQLFDEKLTKSEKDWIQSAVCYFKIAEKTKQNIRGEDTPAGVRDLQCDNLTYNYLLRRWRKGTLSEGMQTASRS